MSLTSVHIEKKPARIYSEEERREAVLLYFIHGTQTKVAELTGIPQRTLSGWIKEPWWAEFTRDLVAACKDSTGAKFRQIIEKAADETLDRLTNGDIVMTKDGPVRKPVSAKDAAVIMAVATDKDRILRGEPTSISGKATSLEDKAAEFARLAEGKKAV